jgi:hypothetical protein
MGLLLVDSYGISVMILSLVGTINQGSLKNRMLIAFLRYVLQGGTYTRITVSMSSCDQGLHVGPEGFFFHSVAMAHGRSRSGMTMNQSPGTNLTRKGDKIFLIHLCPK